MPDRLTWASTIGLFIINFSTLDLHVQDYLESRLPPEEFARIKHHHFGDRLERMKAHVRETVFDPAKRRAIEAFFTRLDPVWVLRNHIAHGVLRMTFAEATGNWGIALSSPKSHDGTNSPEALHLTFEEFVKASNELTEGCEDFMKLFGNWATDTDVSPESA